MPVTKTGVYLLSCLIVMSSKFPSDNYKGCQAGGLVQGVLKSDVPPRNAKRDLFCKWLMTLRAEREDKERQNDQPMRMDQPVTIWRMLRRKRTESKFKAFKISKKNVSMPFLRSERIPMATRSRNFKKCFEKEQKKVDDFEIGNRSELQTRLETKSQTGKERQDLHRPGFGNRSKSPTHDHHSKTNQTVFKVESTTDTRSELKKKFSAFFFGKRRLLTFSPFKEDRNEDSFNDVGKVIKSSKSEDGKVNVNFSLPGGRWANKQPSNYKTTQHPEESSNETKTESISGKIDLHPAATSPTVEENTGVYINESQGVPDFSQKRLNVNDSVLKTHQDTTAWLKNASLANDGHDTTPHSNGSYAFSNADYPHKDHRNHKKNNTILVHKGQISENRGISKNKNGANENHRGELETGVVKEEEYDHGTDVLDPSAHQATVDDEPSTKAISVHSSFLYENRHLMNTTFAPIVEENYRSKVLENGSEDARNTSQIVVHTNDSLVEPEYSKKENSLNNLTAISEDVRHKNLLPTDGYLNIPSSYSNTEGSRKNTPLDNNDGSKVSLDLEVPQTEKFNDETIHDDFMLGDVNSTTGVRYFRNESLRSTRTDKELSPESTIYDNNLNSELDLSINAMGNVSTNKASSSQEERSNSSLRTTADDYFVISLFSERSEERNSERQTTFPSSPFPVYKETSDNFMYTEVYLKNLRNETPEMEATQGLKSVESLVPDSSSVKSKSANESRGDEITMTKEIASRTQNQSVDEVARGVTDLNAERRRVTWVSDKNATSAFSEDYDIPVTHQSSTPDNPTPLIPERNVFSPDIPFGIRKQSPIPDSQYRTTPSVGFDLNTSLNLNDSNEREFLVVQGRNNTDRNDSKGQDEEEVKDLLPTQTNREQGSTITYSNSGGCSSSSLSDENSSLTLCSESHEIPGDVNYSDLNSTSTTRSESRESSVRTSTESSEKNSHHNDMDITQSKGMADGGDLVKNFTEIEVIVRLNCTSEVPKTVDEEMTQMEPSTPPRFSNRTEKHVKDTIRDDTTGHKMKFYNESNSNWNRTHNWPNIDYEVDLDIKNQTSNSTRTESRIKRDRSSSEEDQRRNAMPFPSSGGLDVENTGSGSVEEGEVTDEEENLKQKINTDSQLGRDVTTRSGNSLNIPENDQGVGLNITVNASAESSASSRGKTTNPPKFDLSVNTQKNIDNITNEIIKENQTWITEPNGEVLPEEGDISLQVKNSDSELQIPPPDRADNDTSESSVPGNTIPVTDGGIRTVTNMSIPVTAIFGGEAEGGVLTGSKSTVLSNISVETSSVEALTTSLTETTTQTIQRLTIPLNIPEDTSVPKDGISDNLGKTEVSNPTISITQSPKGQSTYDSTESTDFVDHTSDIREITTDSVISSTMQSTPPSTRTPIASSRGTTFSTTSALGLRTTTGGKIIPFHFTIDADYDETVGVRKVEFQEKLKAQLARVMRVPEVCIQDLEVTRGSVEVSFNLVPSDEHGYLADEDALRKAADELKRLIDNGQLNLNDLDDNTMVVVPLDPPTTPTSVLQKEHTTLILGVVIGVFIITIITVAIAAVVVKRKSNVGHSLSPIEEARTKLPSYREIPFQEALYVKGSGRGVIFGKYCYDSGKWLGPGPEPKAPAPEAVSYRPPTNREIESTPRPPTVVRERLKNNWNLDWDLEVTPNR